MINPSLNRQIKCHSWKWTDNASLIMCVNYVKPMTPIQYKHNISRGNWASQIIIIATMFPKVTELATKIYSFGLTVKQLVLIYTISSDLHMARNIYICSKTTCVSLFTTVIRDDTKSSRYRDPQPRVVKNYAYFFNLKQIFTNLNVYTVI